MESSKLIEELKKHIGRLEEKLHALNTTMKSIEMTDYSECNYCKGQIYIIESEIRTLKKLV